MGTEQKAIWPFEQGGEPGCERVVSRVPERGILWSVLGVSAEDGVSDGFDGVGDLDV